MNVVIDRFDEMVRDEISKNRGGQWTCEMEEMVKFCKCVPK